MDIRFGKPEVDFGNDIYGPGTTVTVTASAWCGSDKFTNRQVVPLKEVGGPAWARIIKDIHVAIVYEILNRHQPTDFTIRQRR